MIQHTVGWPVDSRTYGGSFLYHLDQDRVYVGYVVGLDYADPRFQPFEAFQQFKHHPSITRCSRAASCSATARARSPRAAGSRCRSCEMPGAMLVGDAGGHAQRAEDQGRAPGDPLRRRSRRSISSRPATARASTQRWRDFAGRARALQGAQHQARASSGGLWLGIANAALETLTGGHSPWTLATTRTISRCSRLDAAARRPIAAGCERTSRRATASAPCSSPATSTTKASPCTSRSPTRSICATRCATEYGNPCQNFCPANVYEMVDDGAGGRRLQINAANCVHCKACDIKDPYEIITWTTPEGGSGPNYQDHVGERRGRADLDAVAVSHRGCEPDALRGLRARPQAHRRPRLRGALPLVGRATRAVLAGALGFRRSLQAPRHGTGARARRSHARRGVVRGHTAQFRREPAARATTIRRSCSATSAAPARSSATASCAPRSPGSPPGCASWASVRATASPASCPTCRKP